MNAERGSLPESHELGRLRNRETMRPPLIFSERLCKNPALAASNITTVNRLEHLDRFETWTTAHAGVIHRVARGFAAPDDFNDLFQELLLALWKAIPSFRQDSQPSTFIYRVCHNAALTWKRTQRNYQRKIEHFEAAGPKDEHGPASAIEPITEMLDRLYSEIRELPPVDRSLCLLSLDGVSYREMAAIHGLSESNVGVRLSRLKDKLAEKMKGFSHEFR